jgi:photosystem II stability/assembly factor-like uncharacterized protein
MRTILFFVAAFFIISTANAQWQVQNAGFNKDTLGFYEMSLPDKNTAWAVCYDGKLGLLSGRPVLDFTRTTNGGNTWIPGKMGNDKTLRFSNISAIDKKEAWVAMHKIGPVPNNLLLSFGKGGGVFHTTDGGKTWKQNNCGKLFDNNSVPRFVHFKNKNHGIAVGDPNGGYFEVYTTHNKGKKWKRVARAKLPEPLPNEVAWISGYSVIGNTIWFGTSAGRMYKSTNFGRSWTVHVVDPLPGTYVNEIAFLDDGLTGVTHLRSSTRTFVYSTTDGGLTWTNYFQPPNWKNSRITAVPGTRAFVSTSTHGNQLFTGSSVSYDAGQTWEDIERDAPKAVCRFFDCTTGYAGGFFLTGPPLRGGIYKSQIVFQHPEVPATNNNQVQRTVQQEEKYSALVVKVYPSPASNVINVTLEDAMLDKQAVINLINSEGKIVQTKNSNGSRSVQLNVIRQAPGYYIVSIESGGKKINKSITIVR